MEYRQIRIDATVFRPALPPLALLIGFHENDRPELGMPFAAARCESLPFALLHAGLACAPSVDYVVSPLVTDQFDALDVAVQLSLAGFRGRYVVVIPALPAPHIIRHEIEQFCPDLKVDLVPRARL